jgi:hypothetical protein
MGRDWCAGMQWKLAEKSFYAGEIKAAVHKRA